MIILHRALFYAGGSSYTGSCISGTVISTNGVTGTSSGDADSGNLRRLMLTFRYLCDLILTTTNTLSGGSTDTDYINGVGKGEILLSVLSDELLNKMLSLLYRTTGQEKCFNGIISWW